MKSAEIFDLNAFDNTLFFCNNCANILTVFFNTKGVGKAHCPKCNCDYLVKRFRRKYQFELFDPRESDGYDSNNNNHINHKIG